ncbi:DUF1801 domain-containing protein [Leucobacter sp. G161]|uniref:DUF1801 domain-containing protein n=1 Tax=Leucobacter sp. G161 TaxID=663704 RepID=UPI00073B51FF|nr:DUF1801 domain-containing protein [Leucobacter sp. G161]KUF05833.1 hypothetical protein AUL38_03130 [Leucobacter sp. G161]
MTATEPAMSPSDMPIAEALDRVTGPRRAEADELLALHRAASGSEPVVWAGRILGFGEHHYAYESGRTGRVPELAFATGAKRHTIYLTENFAERWPDLLAELGPHTASKVCLYLTRLTKVDLGVLRTILDRALAETRGGEEIHSETANTRPA